MQEQVVFSGIQPTGSLQLGNYIGAVSNWVRLQNNINTKEAYNNIYCIVDLHAITVFQDPKKLQENIVSMAAILLASGINPDKSILFVQSQNHHHAELAWILNCIARIGWLNRMTAFKEKAGKDKEKSSVGLYIYPNLQAADILLYSTNLVPVGEDQKQHIELCRDIALRFNREYNTDLFTIPDHLIVKDSARVMSLKDATKKMSKSDPSNSAKILLSDSDDDIRQKIMKAKTDSGVMPESEDELSTRLEVANLLKIYSFCADKELAYVVNEYAGKNFVQFKQDLADTLVDVISPIRENHKNLLQNKDYILNILKEGAQKSYDISTPFIKRVKESLGFII